MSKTSGMWSAVGLTSFVTSQHSEINGNLSHC